MDEPLVRVNLPTYNTDHHGKKQFTNNPGEPFAVKTGNISFSALWDTMTKGDVRRPLPFRSPVADFARPGIKCYWIGHATNLIQIGQVFILTDPVFGDHASPIPGLVKRMTPAACRIEDLPPITVILISHDHWDHLDSKGLEKLKAHSPDVIILAGLKVADLIAGWGHKTFAMDWRQKLSYKGIDFACMPARHGSARYGIDFCKRLWCSWLIMVDGISIYFPGDTAIGPHFREVRELAGKPVDLFIAPIGPQEPSSFMRSVHLNPQDAYEMSLILEAQSVYPIHYGCFSLGARPEVEDVTKLMEVWQGTNLHVLIGGGYVEWNGSRFVPAQIL